MQITPWQKTKRIFVFALMHAPSFLGYFFVPVPLGDLKRVSEDVFRSTDSIGSFKKIFVFRPKIEFLRRGNPRFLVKND